MKKFLKTLLIIVLVGVSVGGTAYFFYSKLNKDIDYFEELNFFVDSSENVEFLARLDKVYEETYNSNRNSVKDARFKLIIATNKNLDASLKSLSGYLILADEYRFKDKNISREFSILQSKRSFANSTMLEFKAKSHGASFNPSPAADDIYSAFADYFVSYAELLNKLGKELDVFKMEKDADIKFSIIELYSNICISTFSKLTKKNALVEIEAGENLAYITHAINYNNFFLQTKEADDYGANDFSYLNNLFIKNYNACNKQDFAKKLYVYCTEVGTNLEQDKIKNYSFEKLAAVYFNNIFEVA